MCPGQECMHLTSQETIKVNSVVGTDHLAVENSEVAFQALQENLEVDVILREKKSWLANGPLSLAQS